MADLSDIEKTLVSLIVAAIYPAPYNSGDFQATYALAPFPPATVGSPNPTPVPIITKTYRGWPEEATLDADLALGKAHVSVFSEQGMTRLMDRYFPVDQVVNLPAPTLSWTVSGNVATLAGTISTPQNIAIVVDKAGFSYGVQPADTLTTAAAGLTALIAASRTATSSGAAITIPNSHAIAARVGMFGTTAAEVRRVQQGFRVSVWAASAIARDVLTAMVDNAISGYRDPISGLLTQRFTLPDGSSAYITYRTTYTDDRPTKARLWRRDLCYMVEYADYATSSAPQLIVPIENIQDGAQPLGNFTSSDPPRITVAF